MDQAGENPRGLHAMRVLTGRKDFTLDTPDRGRLRSLSAGLRAADPGPAARPTTRCRPTIR